MTRPLVRGIRKAKVIAVLLGLARNLMRAATLAPDLLVGLGKVASAAHAKWPVEGCKDGKTAHRSGKAAGQPRFLRETPSVSVPREVAVRCATRSAEATNSQALSRQRTVVSFRVDVGRALSARSGVGRAARCTSGSRSPASLLAGDQRASWA